VLSVGCGTAYLKMPQKASGFAIVGLAVWLKLNGGICSDIGIGVTGLGAKPFRARAVEDRLRGRRLGPAAVEEASSQVTQGADPLDDLHASAEYRVHLARLYLTRAVEEAVKRTGGG